MLDEGKAGNACEEFFKDPEMQEWLVERIDAMASGLYQAMADVVAVRSIVTRTDAVGPMMLAFRVLGPIARDLRPICGKLHALSGLLPRFVDAKTQEEVLRIIDEIDKGESDG